ncbi:MAG: Uma2 family endonuclease [Planctomycetes bacterium]|nr:Uma2 family endonuclease [Planctomycetota bacterium]
MPKTLTKKLARDSITFDDFCFLVKEGQKADLIDGVIYMASPDNTDAYRLNKWLLGVLDDFTIELDLGEMFGFRIAFRLDDTNSPEPDIAFLKKARLALVKRGFIDGFPDAAFEIVSPESIERDYKKKRRQYEKHGVGEYWIIDEMEETVTLLRLNRKGKYEEVRAKDGIYHSEVIEGFWLDPTWLWQTPKPKRSVVLKQLLDSVE